MIAPEIAAAWQLQAAAACASKCKVECILKTGLSKGAAAHTGHGSASGSDWERDDVVGELAEGRLVLHALGHLPAARGAQGVRLRHDLG